MFKTETHLHVSEVSRCSHLTAEEMVEFYHNAGYKTLFISDHYHSAYFERLGDSLTWAEKIDCFMSGYKAAKIAGEKYGMNILFSAEVKLDALRNHYLVYGLDETLMKAHPELLALSVEEFYAFTKANGLTVVQAHPYRDGNHFPTPNCVDALEVHNSNPRHDNYTEKAIALAREHHLPMTAGSDAHRPEDIAGTGVITEQEIKTTEDYLDALKNGKLTLIQGETA